MWNRVLLLASGLALGWSLVHLLSVPEAQVRGQRVRVVLGAVVGLGFVIWLSWGSLQAGLAGLVIFALTALIAYAANARQVNRVKPALPPHQAHTSDHPRDLTAVLLVTSAEPLHYGGPSYWAQALMRDANALNWFWRPLAYARIRRAYQVMGGSHPLDGHLTSLVSLLQGRVPEKVQVRHGYQWEQRSFLAALVRLTDEGFSRLVIISLEDEPELGVQLKELMTRSGITDTDIVVSYVQPQALSITSLASRQARLHLLVNGSPVAVPEVAPGEVNSLVSAINQGLEQASALANRLF